MTTAILSALSLAVTGLGAQKSVWHPSSGHKQIRIWPGSAPHPSPVAEPVGETMETVTAPVGGRPWVSVAKVSVPTMTVYSPKGKNTGAAVIVFPGGGYQILAIDLEGTEVCEWLTSRGITAVLLKYRVPGTTLYPHPHYPKAGPYPETPIALEDAQRTMRLVRYHAPEWHIDPHKIGVLGFSAGGHLSAAMSNYFGKRVYRPEDAIDSVSCRPDFAVLLYPGHLTYSSAESDARQGGRKIIDPDPKNTHKRSRLNPDIHVTPQTPPTLLVQSRDDPVDPVANSLVYYAALRKAGVSAELHLYPHGGHAFGLRRTKLPITHWTDLAEKWLRSIGILSK